MADSMSVNPEVLSALNAGGAQAAARAQGESADLQDSFMTLLVTQLQNQDPLKPMENAEMTSQLAQINTVSGIESLNSTLEGINGQIEAGQSLQAAQLIGKGVLVSGDWVLVGEEGAATPFGIELEKPVESLKVSIVAGDGTVLRTLELGPLAAGINTVDWDGLLDSGEVAPAGAYSVVAQDTDGAGEDINPQMLNYAIVNSVTRFDDGVRLDLGGIAAPVELEDVRQIL